MTTNSCGPALLAPQNLVAVFKLQDGGKGSTRVVAFDHRGYAMVADLRRGRLRPVDDYDGGFSHLEWE